MVSNIAITNFCTVIEQEDISARKTFLKVYGTFVALRLITFVKELFAM